MAAAWIHRSNLGYEIPGSRSMPVSMQRRPRLTAEDEPRIVAPGGADALIREIGAPAVVVPGADEAQSLERTERLPGPLPDPRSLAGPRTPTIEARPPHIGTIVSSVLTAPGVG